MKHTYLPVRLLVPPCIILEAASCLLPTSLFLQLQFPHDFSSRKLFIRTVSCWSSAWRSPICPVWHGGLILSVDFSKSDLVTVWDSLSDAALTICWRSPRHPPLQTTASCFSSYWCYYCKTRHPTTPQRNFLISQAEWGLISAAKLLITLQSPGNNLEAIFFLARWHLKKLKIELRWCSIRLWSRNFVLSWVWLWFVA